MDRIHLRPSVKDIKRTAQAIGRVVLNYGPLAGAIAPLVTGEVIGSPLLDASKTPDTSHTATFSLGVRTAEAASISPVTRTESVNSSCGEETNISVPDLNICVGPDQAAIYATSIIYRNTNGQPKYQKDDQVIGLQTGATYRMTNTANRAESYEVVVNDKGELSRTVVTPDGKTVEQVVFIFSGTPNDTAENGRPGLKIELVRHGAWHKDRNEYAEGDPVYAVSALGCTPLDFGLRLEESYLGPKGNPQPAKEAPKPVLPPVQVPSALPRSGDGSTPTESNPNIPRWPGH
jgi:hypothetical protein